MINLLECTLRDGGYINDWKFGYNAIKDMIKKFEMSNVEILELGFLKNEPYDKDRTVFNDVKQINSLIQNKKKNINYAAMVEVVNPLPLDMLDERCDNGIDTIRVIVWKTKHDENGNVVDALEEGYEYCKGIVDKGYKLCVQPARVDQYNDEEFIAMLNKFQNLNPMAIYVVDSWGTQNSNNVIHYINLADKILDSKIAIGYHGHNNLMQAFEISVSLVKLELTRKLFIDASVYGIGRGAGNLNSEIIAKYLNDTLNKNYNVIPMIEIYEKYIKEIYTKHEWGYSIPYYLTAQYNCNPNYGEYYGITKKLSVISINNILKNIKDDDKVLFSKQKADFYQSKYEKNFDRFEEVIS
jgi:4-hydroxy 2-oxovalerate aldolase